MRMMNANDVLLFCTIKADLHRISYSYLSHFSSYIVNKYLRPIDHIRMYTYIRKSIFDSSVFTGWWIEMSNNKIWIIVVLHCIISTHTYTKYIDICLWIGWFRCHQINSRSSFTFSRDSVVSPTKYDSHIFASTKHSNKKLFLLNIISILYFFLSFFSPPLFSVLPKI